MIVLRLLLITSTMCLLKGADQPGDFQNHLRQPSRDNNVAISDPGHTTDSEQNVTTADTIEHVVMELLSWNPGNTTDSEQNVTTADTIELDVSDDDQPSDVVMELNSWNSWADQLRWEVEDARIPMELTSPIDMRYLH